MRTRRLVVVTAVLVVASVVLAGPAMKGNLHGKDGAQGFVKLKLDKADLLQLFEVQIRKVPADTYSVFVFDEKAEPPAWVEVGSLEIGTDGSAAKLKVNTSRGDLDPIGFDPRGADIEVRNSLAEVVLDGEIPAAKVKGPK